MWKGYPFCGCGCPTLYTLANVDIASAVELNVRNSAENEDAGAGAAASATDKIAAGFAPLCYAPKYYSQNSCKCVCHYKYCGPRKYIDENTCSCWDYIY